MTQRDTSIIGIPSPRDDPPWLHVVPTSMTSDTQSNSLAATEWRSRCAAGAIVIWAGVLPMVSSSIYQGWAARLSIQRSVPAASMRDCQVVKLSGWQEVTGLLRYSASALLLGLPA